MDIKIKESKMKHNNKPVYIVSNKNTGRTIGHFMFYRTWQEFAFYPSDATIWSKGLLKQVIKQLEKAVLRKI